MPGIRAFVQNPPVINIGGRSSKSLYQFTLQSSDIQALYQGAATLEQRLHDVPGLTDVTSDLQIKNPQVQVSIDRDRAAALGIDVNQIESALYDAYGARQVSTIYTPNDQYWVVMELLPEYQRDLTALNLLHISGRNGVSVPLGSLAQVKPGTGPLSVNHSGQLPSVTLSFNLEPGVSSGRRSSGWSKQPGRFCPRVSAPASRARRRRSRRRSRACWLLLVMAILVIYLVLGILYESFIHPMTILSGLPFAGFGALLDAADLPVDLNIYAFVGIIMLIGIVKKNAIMMIDFAIEARAARGQHGPQMRFSKRASVRFRPIMMTTMAALMGTLPIALGTGPAPSRGGRWALRWWAACSSRSCITLYITPVVYTYHRCLAAAAGPPPVRAPQGYPEAAAADARVAEATR